MAYVFDSTVSGANANSLATEVQAITYMGARLNSSLWPTQSGTTLTDDEKKALTEATRELTGLVWCGERSTEAQALDWPRQSVRNPDSPTHQLEDDGAIPTRIVEACVELAFQFLKAGTTDVAALEGTSGIKRERLDVLETEYFEHSGAPEGLRRFPRVWRKILPYLEVTSDLVAPLVKG